MSITDEKIVRMNLFLRNAMENELTNQAAAERIAQLLAGWNLSEGELNDAIDRRVRLLQDQRRIIDDQAKTLNYIRERALAIHRAKEKTRAQA